MAAQLRVSHLMLLVLLSAMALVGFLAASRGVASLVYTGTVAIYIIVAVFAWTARDGRRAAWAAFCVAGLL